ncbi:MAG: OmpA family protein [Alcaligenaceae bacterium]|nr:OmpA family protein [Alcaligenaceae bacterium]
MMKLHHFTSVSLLCASSILLTGCVINPAPGSLNIGADGRPASTVFAGTLSPSNWNDLAESIRASDNQRLGVEVNRVHDGSLRVILPANSSFRSGKTQINKKMNPVLDKIVNELIQSQNLRIKVVGHTDSQGDEVNNQALSVQRAATVAHYLIRKGVKSVRIDIEGRGAIDPLMTNDTAQGRAINRRIELYLYELK